MKKVIWTVVGAIAICYGTVCIASMYNGTPKQLVPLQAQFGLECGNAKWDENRGITDESLDYRLKQIVEQRNSKLKDLGIKSFNAKWTCSALDARNGKATYIKPEASFIGLYWR